MAWNNLNATQPDVVVPLCATEGCGNPRRSKNPRGDGGFYCPPCRTKMWQQENPERHRANSRRGKRRRKDANRAFIDGYKVAKGCMDCGYRQHPEALEFDHVRGTKQANLAEAVGQTWSRERILAEIAKCDVVCANCHRIRTFTRRNEVGEE